MLLLAGILCRGGVLGQEPTTAELFEERARSVVMVEYYIEQEVDRQSREGLGLVIREDGLLVCLQGIFPNDTPPELFRDITVYAADNPEPEGFGAKYRGRDPVHQWHYLQLEDPEAAMRYLTPLTAFGEARPERGERVWGIGLTRGGMDYLAYLLEGTVSANHRMQMELGFASPEVAMVGGPVFNAEGVFAGWAMQPIPEERDFWIGGDFFRATLRNPDESGVYLLAEELTNRVFERIPEAPLTAAEPWIGVGGLEPLDPETARFLELGDQGAVVLSEILPETPAEEAGLRDRDIVVAVGGEVLPRLRPVQAQQSYFQMQLRGSAIGEPLSLRVLRGTETVDVAVVPQERPRGLREAERHYFEEIGLGLRELVLEDSLQRREDYREAAGVVVRFVRPNSPAAEAELRHADWIVEVGGEPVPTFTGAVAHIGALLEEEPEELVLLVKRGNETSVRRVRLP